MKYELNYIETNMKRISQLMPQYYDHILDEKELDLFISILIKEYSDTTDKNKILEATAKTNLMSEYFDDIQNKIVFGKISDTKLDDVYRYQTEKKYIADDYDIAYSRNIRYIPPQWHVDDFFQIYYAPLGECPIVFENEEFLLNPGYLMIISPGVIHATPCLKDDTVLEHFFMRASTFDQVFFKPLGTSSILSHFFRKTLDPKTRQTGYLVFDINKDKDIEQIIENLIEESTNILSYSSNMLNTLMAQLFIVVLRRYEHTARMPMINDVRWKHEFTEIVSYIEKNYATVTQEELAEKFSYSARQINRIIHGSLNMTYVDLITFLRMQKAAELLKKERYSMEQISDMLGYNNLSSFYRAFKKYYRLTPVQYLKQDII